MKHHNFSEKKLFAALYGSSEEAIAAWKCHTDHKAAQETGQRVWYSNYHLRVARVAREAGTNEQSTGTHQED